MKICPECNCTDVPETSSRCPFCGFRFVQEGMFKDDNISDRGIVLNQEKTGLADGAALNEEEAVSAPLGKKRRKNRLGIYMVMALAGGAIVISSYKSVMRDGNAQNAEEIEERSSEEETIESSFMEETEEEKDERTLLLEQIPYCDQYILPLSDRIYLERADLEGLTAEQLRIARNEIYARHGRIFKDEMLNAYFQGCSWYNGSLTPEEFSDKVFNEYENANKSLIVSYEHELGVNGQ